MSGVPNRGVCTEANYKKRKANYMRGTALETKMGTTLGITLETTGGNYIGTSVRLSGQRIEHRRTLGCILVNFVWFTCSSSLDYSKVEFLYKMNAKMIYSNDLIE